MTIEQLEKMAAEVKADAKLLQWSNRPEALTLFRTWRKLMAEIETRKRCLLFPAYVLN